MLGTLKESRIGRFIERGTNFIKESWVEVCYKVSWPDFWKETWTFSKVVLLVIIVFAIYLGALDAFFSWLMGKIGVY